MKRIHKPLKIVIIATLLIIVWFVVDTILILQERSTYIQSYKQYCPMNCPNTLWTCTEGDIYFVVDENCKVLGAAGKGGNAMYYEICFDWRSSYHGFSLFELDSISYPDTRGLGHRFDGRPKFTEGCCVVTYKAADDKKYIFGRREGEVTLTFIKSDLTAPFSFQSEESLNELPFR